MENSTRNNLFAGTVCVVMIFVLITISITYIQTIKIISNEEISDKEIFTQIYSSRAWGGFRGVGPGSTAEDGAAPFLDFLQDFLNSHKDISSIVDIGCGYGELLKNIQFPENSTYLGLDIVDDVIDYNQKHYLRPNVKFATVDNVESLSAYKGDLLILKDVIQHWSTPQILYAKEYIIPNFKYAIVVNNIKTTDFSVLNSDIKTGSSRPLDLKAVPFLMEPEFIKDYELPPYITKRIHVFINKKDK